MPKKKNPEQEEQPGTEEKEETPAQEPEEEEPGQEQEPEEQEDPEQPGEEEAPEDPQEEQPGAQQEQPPTEDPGENAGLKNALLQAQGKLAAYAAGVAPGMIDDAVTLAMAEASKAGEVTEAAVTKAMEAVLKRHPEWKADDGKKKNGGFRLGADRDSGGTYKKPANDTTKNVKRWNRFK